MEPLMIGLAILAALVLIPLVIAAYLFGTGESWNAN